MKSRRMLFLLFALPANALFWGKEHVACTLECRNDGVCKESMTEIHTGGDVHNAHDYAPARKFYCQCPVYFDGPECEIQYSPCPDGDDENTKHKKCENGAACTRDTTLDGTVYFHCGCQTDTTDFSSPAARRTCQRMGTVFCLPDNKKAEEIHQSLGNAGGAFCRNDGTCKEWDTSKPIRSQHHPGCECPLEWTGEHCEIPGDEALKAKFHMGEPNTVHVENNVDLKQQGANFRLTIAWICLVVVLTMLGGIGFAIWDGMRESKRQRQRRLQKATQIPRQISAKVKKSSRQMEPLEVESF